VGDESAASRFVFLRHLREMLMFVGGPKTNYQPWGVASVYAARAKYRPWGVASAAQRLINYPSVERVLSRTMQIYVSSLVAKRLLLPLVVLVCCQFSFSFSSVCLGISPVILGSGVQCGRLVFMGLVLCVPICAWILGTVAIYQSRYWELQVSPGLGGPVDSYVWIMCDRNALYRPCLGLISLSLSLSGSLWGSGGYPQLPEAKR
jgi:hypothetical protein